MMFYSIDFNALPGGPFNKAVPATIYICGANYVVNYYGLNEQAVRPLEGTVDSEQLKAWLALPGFTRFSWIDETGAKRTISECS